VVTAVVAGDCPIMGLGSFGTLAFWGRDRVRCMGPPMPTGHPLVNETITKLIAETGVVRVKGRLTGGRRIAFAVARDSADRRPWARATWHGSAWPPADVDFIQLSKIRGAANGRVETSRGRKSLAQEL
jgi:hypothetical protein